MRKASQLIITFFGILTASLFPSAGASDVDLEVEQEILWLTNGHVEFGTPLTYIVEVVNRGSGYASNASLRVNFSGILQLRDPYNFFNFYSNSVIQPFGRTFSPGQRYQLPPITVFPSELGVGSNLVVVSCPDDTNISNNSLLTEISIVPQPFEHVVTTPGAGFDVVFDRATKDIFFIDGWGELSSFDPQRRRFTTGQGLISPVGWRGVIGAAPRGGLLYVAGLTDRNTVRRYDTLTKAVEEIRVSGVIETISVSPNDSDLIAVSGPSEGTSLYHNEVRVSRNAVEPGAIGFSEDGTRLYHIPYSEFRLEECQLNVYLVKPDRLELERTHGLCEWAGPFRQPTGVLRVEDGLLYFANGAVFNPATGMAVGQIPGASQESLIVPDGFGNINVVGRTNDLWVVRRIRAATLEEYAQVGVPGPDDVVISGVSWDEESIAFGTQNTRTYFVTLPLDPEDPRARVRVAKSGEVELRFGTYEGARYVIERTESLSEPQWSRVDEVEGTGGTTTYTLSPAGETEFFRVVRPAIGEQEILKT